MPNYVAAIDQGTTSTRCMIFDHGGNIIAVDQREHRQIYPKPGWVEHDALEIWERVQEVMRGALAKASNQLSVSSDQITAIGITNQRETTVVWEKSTGKPICAAGGRALARREAGEAGSGRFGFAWRSAVEPERIFVCGVKK